MCGLSNDQPFCDDSHKKIVHEEDNKIYVDENEGNNRVEIKNCEECYNDT